MLSEDIIRLEKWWRGFLNGERKLTDASAGAFLNGLEDARRQAIELENHSVTKDARRHEKIFEDNVVVLHPTARDTLANLARPFPGKGDGAA